MQIITKKKCKLSFTLASSFDPLDNLFKQTTPCWKTDKALHKDILNFHGCMDSLRVEKKRMRTTHKPLSVFTKPMKAPQGWSLWGLESCPAVPDCVRCIVMLMLIVQDKLLSLSALWVASWWNGKWHWGESTILVFLIQYCCNTNVTGQ